MYSVNYQYNKNESASPTTQAYIYTYPNGAVLDSGMHRKFIFAPIR